MNRFLIPLGGFVLLAIVLAVGLKHSPEKGIIASPLVGKSAPAFTTTLLNDTSAKFDSAEFKGRWTLFNVWGTWCVECRAEHAVLMEMSKQGVVPIIGLDWKDKDNEALAVLQQMGNPYAAVAADRDGREAIDWGVYGAPETFLVNDRGVVVYKYIGALTREAWEKQFLPRIPARQAAKS